jgi:hypothetical protein
MMTAGYFLMLLVYLNIILGDPGADLRRVAGSSIAVRDAHSTDNSSITPLSFWQ